MHNLYAEVCVSEFFLMSHFCIPKLFDVTDLQNTPLRDCSSLSGVENPSYLVETITTIYLFDAFFGTVPGTCPHSHHPSMPAGRAAYRFHDITRQVSLIQRRPEFDIHSHLPHTPRQHLQPLPVRHLDLSDAATWQLEPQTPRPPAPPPSGLLPGWALSGSGTWRKMWTPRRTTAAAVRVRHASDTRQTKVRRASVCVPGAPMCGTMISYERGREGHRPP